MKLNSSSELNKYLDSCEKMGFLKASDYDAANPDDNTYEVRRIIKASDYQ